MSYEWSPQSVVDNTPVSLGQLKSITFAIPAGIWVRFLVASWFNNDSVTHTIVVALKQSAELGKQNVAVSTVVAGAANFALPAAGAFSGDIQGGQLEVCGPIDIIFEDLTALNDAGPLTMPVVVNWIERSGPVGNGIVPAVVVT